MRSLLDKQMKNQFSTCVTSWRNGKEQSTHRETAQEFHADLMTHKAFLREAIDQDTRCTTPRRVQGKRVAGT